MSTPYKEFHPTVSLENLPRWYNPLPYLRFFNGELQQLYSSSRLVDPVPDVDVWVSIPSFTG